MLFSWSKFSGNDVCKIMKINHNTVLSGSLPPFVPDKGFKKIK